MVTVTRQQNGSFMHVPFVNVCEGIKSFVSIINMFLNYAHLYFLSLLEYFFLIQKSQQSA